MKEQTRMILRLAVGLYLIYLAYSLITGQAAGGTGMSDLLAYGAGGVLALCGVAFCGFAVLRYRKERKADQTACGEEPNTEEP